MSFVCHSRLRGTCHKELELQGVKELERYMDYREVLFMLWDKKKRVNYKIDNDKWIISY